MNTYCLGKWFWRIGGTASCAFSVFVGVRASRDRKQAAADRQEAAWIAEGIARSDSARAMTDTQLIDALDWIGFSGEIKPDWLKEEQRPAYNVSGGCGAYLVKGVRSYREALRVAVEMNSKSNFKRECNR